MGKLERWTLGLCVVVVTGYASVSCVTEPVDVVKCEMANPDCPAELPVCKPSADDPAVGRCEPCEPGSCQGNGVCDLSAGRCVRCLEADDCGSEKPVCKLAEKSQDNECVECMESDDCGSASKPACDLDRNRCVQCVEDAQCEGRPESPVCDTTSHSCVACNSHSDCGSAELAQCDSATHSCVPCTLDAHCASQGHLDICLDGRCEESCGQDDACQGDPQRLACGKSGFCVECTPSDEEACEGMVCNPETELCTTLEQGSKRVCEPCIADSECGDEAENPSPTHRCVPLVYQGAAQGGRCLEQRASSVPECASPFLPEIFRESLSGEQARAYCGIKESLTTCEAVVAAASATRCSSGDAAQCAPAGALCENMSGTNFCSYPCDFNVECPEGAPACMGGRCRVP